MCNTPISLCSLRNNVYENYGSLGLLLYLFDTHEREKKSVSV